MTDSGSPGVSAVILAGGKSERMGADKARLPWRDGRTLLERMAGCLGHLDEVLLSVGSEEQAHEKNEKLSLPVVVDRYPDRGPLGGLYSALLACRGDWLLAVSCDLPLFERELADYLISRLTSGMHGGCSVLLTMTRDKRVHPLCGLYSRRAADVFGGLMASGNYRMMDAARKAGFSAVSLEGTPFPDEMLANVNTFREYALLFAGRAVRRPPVVAVCGLKKSGKTSLLEKLVPELVRRGLRVAVIKHDAHGFAPDVPGTDSFRLKAAGASGTAVYSTERWMAVKDARGTTAEQMAEHFPDADLILLEGGKASPYPKIEIVRKGIFAPASAPVPASDPAALLALCTDGDFRVAGVPSFSLDDYEGLAAFVMESVK
jgi:molybdopterin-guanine dinucleotide biosynthesis protein MobB